MFIFAVCTTSGRLEFVVDLCSLGDHRGYSHERMVFFALPFDESSFV